MTDHEHSTFSLDDDEGGKLHLAWSRSGRTLGIAVADRNFAEFRQVGLRADQIEQLIAFLVGSLEERQTRN